MKFLEQACLKKVVFQRTLESLMMASPNDYMYIIFPCLTTYLMQVLKMCFFVQLKKQSAKKHPAENIKQNACSIKQQKSIPQKSIQQNSIRHDCREAYSRKAFPQKVTLGSVGPNWVRIGPKLGPGPGIWAQLEPGSVPNNVYLYSNV